VQESLTPKTHLISNWNPILLLISNCPNWLGLKFVQLSLDKIKLLAALHEYLYFKELASPPLTLRPYIQPGKPAKPSLYRSRPHRAAGPEPYLSNLNPVPFGTAKVETFLKPRKFIFLFFLMAFLLHIHTAHSEKLQWTTASSEAGRKGITIIFYLQAMANNIFRTAYYSL